MELYGRILGNSNVLSSTQGTSREESEKVWDSMYPSEPYELVGLNNHSLQGFTENFLEAKQSTTKYDLISAVKRQTTFFYQVIKKFRLEWHALLIPTKPSNCSIGNKPVSDAILTG